MKRKDKTSTYLDLDESSSGFEGSGLCCLLGIDPRYLKTPYE